MIFLKKIDAIVQVLMVVFVLIMSTMFDNSWWMLGYFLLGGWQLMSTIITRLFARHLPSVFQRDYYIKTLLVLVALALLLFAIPSFTFFYLYALLFIGPVLAVWYIIITWQELLMWQKRHLIQLR